MKETTLSHCRFTIMHNEPYSTSCIMMECVADKKSNLVSENLVKPREIGKVSVITWLKLESKQPTHLPVEGASYFYQ